MEKKEEYEKEEKKREERVEGKEEGGEYNEGGKKRSLSWKSGERKVKMIRFEIMKFRSITGEVRNTWDRLSTTLFQDKV